MDVRPRLLCCCRSSLCSTWPRPCTRPGCIGTDEAERGKDGHEFCNSLSSVTVYQAGIPRKETPVATTASDVLIDSIYDWGVEVIFGLPGDGINGIIEALRKRQDKIRFIHVRHEEAAAFMACAYAKYTGKLGCCLATSGPGGIHLLNGLYDAKLDGAPVLAITGLQVHDLVNTHSQHDVELDKLFMDVSVYHCGDMGAEHVQNVADVDCEGRV